MTDNVKFSLLEAALWYAQANYKVFPLSPGSKIPYAGSRGLLDATSDLVVINDWWRERPDSGIGLSTEGLLVVDEDPGCAPTGLSSVWEQRTPRGGRHVVFSGGGFRSSANKLADKTDIRADGGYIVVAPTPGYAGTPVARKDLPAPPAHLVEALKRHDSPTVPVEGVVPQGSRHAALLARAGLMRGWGFSEGEIEAGLLIFNQERCSPPSPDSEVKRIARDIGRKPAERDAADGAFSLPALDAKLSPSVGLLEEIDDPGPVPAELLLRVPGLIADVIEYNMASDFFPNPVLAWAGATCLMSFLAARKVHFERTMPNVYILGLALSGGGKEHPRTVNTEILAAAGLTSNLGDRFASGEGIEDALLTTPSLLFHSDEIDGMLEASTLAKDQRFRGVRDMILSLYGEAGGRHVCRRKAGGGEPGIILRPSLTLFGTAIPEHCYGAMNEEMVTKGLLSRMLIVDSVRGEWQDYKAVAMPETILAKVKWWKSFNSGNLDSGEPVAATIDPDARAFLRERDLAYDAVWREGQAKGDNIGCGLNNRVMLQARKLSLLWACSDWKEGPAPRITLDAIKWATEIVQWLSRRTLAMFAKNSRANLDFEKQVEKFLGVLVKSGGSLPHRAVTTHMRGLNKSQFDMLVGTLVDREKIAVEPVATSGRPTKIYRIL